VHRKSILRTVACDLKKLPIGALEAFVLSQVRGGSTAEDVAEATGLELSELFRVARTLADLGALSVDGEKGKTKRPTVAPAGKRRSGQHAAGKRMSGQHSAGKAAAAPVQVNIVPVRGKHGDLRSLGIGPREGFVLSQIDGATSVADLCEITGLAASDLSAALRALEAVGVVDLGAGRNRPSISAPSATVPKPPAAVVPAARPPPQEEACDLTEAERARITETSTRLETLDLYGVLGVQRDADAKVIRRAYHSLAGQFHPDRFFGKKLGPLRRPLERAFMRLTLAYDTLSKGDKRAQYDATLPPPPSKRGQSLKPGPASKRAPTQKPPAVRTPSRKSMNAMAAAIPGVQSRPVVPPVAPIISRPVSPPVISRPASPPVAPIAPPVSRPVSPPVVPSPTPPVSARAAGSAPESAPRSMGSKDRRLPQERALVFVHAAEEALDRHDFVAAANSYRLAVQCSDDPALKVALAETDAKARRRVRETSLAGASAAEQAGRWGEAAAKYAKAHTAHPEAWVAERAANAMRLDGGDLRAAARFAEQAVLAEPGNAAYRVTLGEIYFDAGLLARAAGESSRAIALAPGDLRAAALAKLVAKGKRA
jgi:predicted transcriptional regulator/tetratricopeptide (TPR) repeat protein